MASIKCGNCAETHGSVQEVRDCYGNVQAASWSAPAQPVVENWSKPVREPATEGWYIYPRQNGKVYKIQRSQSSGFLYAKVLNPEGGWSVAPNMARTLTLDDKLTAAEAAKYGKLYGVCCICGRVLTNEESIEAGIGPICAGRIS